ncbi:MAG: hypothetical protein ACYSWX_09425 [Planctomycetota bacterium]|jgi:hypothetical protein
MTVWSPFLIAVTAFALQEPSVPGAEASPAAEPLPITVRWVDPPRALVLHRPVELRLAIDLTPEALAGELLPILNRPLDLPLSIQGAWSDMGAGLAPLEATSGGLETATGPLVVVGDAVERLEPVPGAAGASFVLGRWFEPVLSGPLVLPPPTVRYATAEAFEVDWLGDRRAVGRVEGFARGERLELEVRGWPRIDEPERFSGLIGKFGLTASATPRDLEVGEELELVLSARGEGGAASFQAPRIDWSDGLEETARVVEVERSLGDGVEVRVRYRLRATSAAVFELAPGSWTWLADDGERLVEGTFEAVPLVVREGPRAASASPEAASSSDRVADSGPESHRPEADPENGSRSLFGPIVMAGLAGAVVVGLLLRRR